MTPGVTVVEIADRVRRGARGEIGVPPAVLLEVNEALVRREAPWLTDAEVRRTIGEARHIDLQDALNSVGGDLIGALKVVVEQAVERALALADLRPLVDAWIALPPERVTKWTGSRWQARFPAGVDESLFRRLPGVEVRAAQVEAACRDRLGPSGEAQGPF